MVSTIIRHISMCVAVMVSSPLHCKRERWKEKPV